MNTLVTDDERAQLLANGRGATGVITSVWFVKDRGRVEYDFEFQGQRLHGWNA